MAGEVGPVGGNRRRERVAALFLLGACLLWGMGFNWNKQAQALLGERLAATFDEPSLEQLGPAAFLAIRFLSATLCWAFLFPASLGGWSWTTIRGGVLTGSCLGFGILLQHYGLARTSESLSAFLTSLTVLFTPMIAVVLLRHRIGGWMWSSVACATAGVALMTLYREERGFDAGAWLGLGCAVVFSAHMLLVDYFGHIEDRRRFSLAQFLVAGLIFASYTVFASGGHRLLDVRGVVEACSNRDFLILLLVTTVPGTLVSFGLMIRFQPDVSATRAALLYLSEPLFATTYAWLAVGTTITIAAMTGAGLILGANLLAELTARAKPASKSEGLEPSSADQDARSSPLHPGAEVLPAGLAERGR
ncbi:MAG: DMT family transporter [Planctomycetota bacterium]